DLVGVSDSQITALAGEAFIQRIGTQYRACGDFIALSHGGPAFDVDIGLEHAVRAYVDIGLDYAELADLRAAPDPSVGMHTGGRGYYGRWIDGHESSIVASLNGNGRGNRSPIGTNPRQR